MATTDGLFDFLEPVDPSLWNHGSHPYPKGQIKEKIQVLSRDFPDWDDAEIILVGCGVNYGDNEDSNRDAGIDAIRKSLYEMYDWHPNIKVADMGNIREGATPTDTRAGLRSVLKEIEGSGKIAVVLGGSNDLMMQQYEIFEQNEKMVDIALIDRYIDLEDSEGLNDKNFLMPIFTKDPNYVSHYSHIAFQSYDVNPKVLETLDKLSFDCFRLGTVREQLEEMEPVLRHCHLVGIDLQVLRFSEALFLKNASPNGLFGDEVCQLAQYAGMSTRLSSFGIFGYDAARDTFGQGAKLVAQMLWYFVDGYRIRKQEMDLNNLDNFISYHVKITGIDNLFIQSKRTRRWWMKLPNAGGFVPCSYQDYLTACNEEIPERWIKAQNRIV